MKIPLLLTALLLPAAEVTAQTYFFDGDLVTTGIQNGAGAWSTDAGTATNLRWLKDGAYSAWDNSGLAIAEFGSTASTSGGVITLAGEIKAAGLNFTPLGSPLGSAAYSFTGGTLNLGNGGVINVANGASGGGLGGQWITFNSPLKASNLTIQKNGGATIGFVRINTLNPDLTGILTLKSTADATSGIYASIASPTYISSLSGVVVEPFSVFNPTGTGTYAVPITFAGVGASHYGAIRVDPSNTVFSGPLTLNGDGRFHTHINTVNTTLSGSIGETGGSWSFNRTANAPVGTTLPLTATYTGASTYTGATVFGRVLPYFTTVESGGTEGGVNILDFSAATAPDSNILYNGVTPGALQMVGGLGTPTVLQMNGAAGEHNSQTFASTSAQQSATALTLVSGFGGSMSAHLGNLTRAGDGVLAITAPQSGQITATAGGSSEGLIGTWATYRSADGKTGGWAGLKGGQVGLFTGGLEYESDTSVTSLSGYSSSAHLNISSSSSGSVIFDNGLNLLSTLSMTDPTAPRMLDVTGQILRLAGDGGIQITQGAHSLTLGLGGDGSTLTAGSGTDVGGQIMLTNMSSNRALTINSAIANNGSGSVGLNINGTGRVVLTRASSFTGYTILQSGTLEIANGMALGASGASSATKIMSGATLQLRGSLTVGETIQANGHGVNLAGAIRNLSGTNTLTAAVRAQSATRFTSDSGSLILAGGITGQISGIAYTFSGNGNIEVRGPLTSSAATITKEGSGTLTLSGASSGTGVVTLGNGLLHLDFNHASAPATNMLFSGATLSASVGVVSLSGGALQATGKVDSTTTQAFGGLTLNSGSSRLSATSTGTGSMDVNLGVIVRNIGSTLRFDLPSSGAFKTSSGTDNALLTGTGGVAYATVDLNDWAATTTASGGLRNIVGLSSLGLYTPSAPSALAGNADIAAGVPTTNLAANTAISSLRFNEPQATSIGQSTAGVVLTTGGILVTPAVGANTSTLSVSSLRAAVGSTDLTIFQNNTAAPLVLTGRILNTTTTGGTVTTTNLTKTGPGTLVMQYGTAFATGDYTGATRIQNGSLQLVKTVSTGISYYLNAGTTFTLGSGSTSGKLVLGSDTTGHAVTAYGGLRTEGSGTGNALVGGTAATATFLHYVSGTLDFRNGTIGGSGTYENNLHLTISLGTLQLGPANTYNGKTNLLQNTIEVSKLADRGLPSSLGTGDVNASAHIIDMATATTGSQGFTALATLRYTGDTDSVTNRPLNISNADVPGDVVSVIAVLENTGTGTVKFTAPFTTTGSNTSQRTLRLGGSNQGANEIVSLADGSATIISRLEKTGTGTWTLTGASTYSGGTRVDAGTLLVTNLSGSATGSGDVVVAANAVLGGSGRIAPGADRSITITGGTLQIGTELPGQAGQSASTLTLETSGSGSLSFLSGTTLAFDLFSGAGMGDNSDLYAAADRALFSGLVNFSEDTRIKVSNPTGMTGWAANDSWKLFDWAGLATDGSGPPAAGSALFDLPALPEGMVWNTDALWTSGVLSISLVPEPSRAMLMLTFALFWLGRRQRKTPAGIEAEPLTHLGATAAPAFRPLPAVIFPAHIAGPGRISARCPLPLPGFSLRPLHPAPCAPVPARPAGRNVCQAPAAPQTCPGHGSAPAP